MNNQKKVVIIPCSGIGKTYGTVSREAAYEVTDDIRPDKTQLVALSLLVLGDEETRAAVAGSPVITIDGCKLACATKMAQESGGTVVHHIYMTMNTPGVVAGGVPTIVTLSGLAQHMIELYWPVIAETTGFSNPEAPPTFLTLETAQYYMAHLIKPLLAEGMFSSVTIQRNSLCSQILDNLNKAAVVGFYYTQIGERLNSAWSGEPGQARVYDDAQTCATMFREYCLAHNLLDFSLQVEVFWNQLWKSEICKKYLTGRPPRSPGRSGPR